MYTAFLCKVSILLLFNKDNITAIGYDIKCDAKYFQ